MLRINWKSIYIVFFGLTLVARFCTASQVKNVFPDDNARLSYAFGAKMGREMRKIAPGIDPDAYLRAVDDVFHERDLWLSSHEIKRLKRESVYLQNTAKKTVDHEKSSANLLSSIDAKKMGYAFGIDFGSHLLKLDSNVNLDFVFLGYKNQSSNKQSLLSLKDENRLIRNFFHKQKQTLFNTVWGKQMREGISFLVKNKNEPGVRTTKKGLQYKVIVEGTGMMPTEKDIVTILYKGVLLDGTVIASSEEGVPSTLKLSQTIAGLREGLMLMREGSKYQFFIPDRLAFGYKGFSNKIGPYAVLMYDVELVFVQRSR